MKSKYRKLCKLFSVELDDLEQTIWMALVKASVNYDPSRGVSFKTYAYTSIHRYVNRYITQITRKHISTVNIESLEIDIPDDNASRSFNYIDYDNLLIQMQNPDIVKMNICDGMNYREISKETGMSHEILRIKIKRDISRIRKKYEYEAARNNRV